MEQPTDWWTAFDYAVVDVEGNGQRPPDLVEISIVAIKDGSIGQARNWLVRPPQPITSMALRVLDTLKLARRLLPGRGSYKLGPLVDAFGLARGLPADLMPHRATYDALVCARLLSHFATPPGREPLTLVELLEATVGKATTDKALDEPAATLF